MINQQDFKKKFIDSTLKKIVRSRVLRKTPYFYDLILKKYHPLNIPYNELDFRGFEKYYFDDNKPPLLINVFCTTPPVDLSNSNCYTHLHTFVNFN